MRSLSSVIRADIAERGGWIGFDRYMELALYAPGLGYYSRSPRPFGADFVTAPEISPHFGRALAHQVVEGLDATGADTLVEFGAGSGALAAQLLDALGERVACYEIVDVSGALRAEQARTLARFGARVRWLDAWPSSMHAVVLGNEVLDAMPVALLHFDGTRWCERGVVPDGDGFAFADRPTAQRPPHDGPFPAGYLTERHAHAEAFIRTLAERLERGVVLLIDYGFPAAEYFHPQRSGGTLMCHRAHRADTAPLADPGDKDITAHVDWTAMALTAQDAGLDVLGYTSLANFLIGCGMLDGLEAAPAAERTAARKLLLEHEMGELFKVLALGRGVRLDQPIGFAQGDRSHTL